jgi:catechol 2,3-dioxygenase
MTLPDNPFAWRKIAPPDRPLPAATRLGRVVLQVGDLDRSLAFYRDTVGLRLLASDADRAELGAVGDDRVLVELRRNPQARPLPQGGRLGLYHVALLLPTRADLGRFVTRLLEIPLPAGAADHLVSEALYLTDPDGLGLEVYADRPRDRWSRRSGEIAMGSDPLDLDDLIRAGGDAPWSGVPTGSVIGHVHLYVDDLTQAAAFYHRGVGLEVAVGSFPGALFLAAGGYHHHLGLNTWARGARPADPDDPRLLAWELVLPTEGDVESAAARLTSSGFEVAQRGRTLEATDPWRIPIRLRPDDQG